MRLELLRPRVCYDVMRMVCYNGKASEDSAIVLESRYGERKKETVYDVISGHSIVVALVKKLWEFYLGR